MKIKLSHHAIRRYLERIEGINLKPIFSEMKRLGYGRRQLSLYLRDEFGLTDELLRIGMIPTRTAHVMSDGDGYVKHGRHRFVIRGRTLVTIKGGL